MKARLKDKLSYDWIYYVLCVILSIIIWVYGFKLYHLPKKYEKLTLFFAGDVKDYKFQDDVVNDIDILQCEISSINVNDKAFKQKYDLVGLNNSDICLVPISIANNTACYVTFKELDNNYNMEYFVQDGKNYGIIINKSYLENYFNFENEDYVILINANSINAGDITNHSYDLVKWMVHYNG